MQRSETRKPVRFVILVAPRTGSNWLCTLLDSHPEILCHHELFHRQGIHLAQSVRRGEVAIDLGSIVDRDHEPAAWLRRAWRAHHGHRAIGFKANRDQPRQAFEVLFAQRGLRAILLRRRNRIKTFVSEMVAEATGEWESYFDLELTSEKQIQIDVADFEAHLERNERYYAWLEEALDKTDWPVLETFYEDLANPLEHHRLLDFLGVDPTLQLSAATRKQTSRDLRQVILNFDDLATALADGPHRVELLSLKS